MKKILLSTIALMMSVAMMAIGLGDGSSKANALDFDWTTDNVHDATEALWYNVSLAPVNAANEPAVVLYLTNLTDEEATVDVTVSIASAQRTVTYTIAARDYYRLDIPVDQYREFITLDEISLMIKSNVKLSLGAKVYEFDEYVKEAIANSEPIDWNSGVQQDALSTKWYDVDITSLKTNKEHLQVTFKNKAENQALVSATFVFEGKHVSLPLSIPAGFTTTKVIDYQLLSKLPARVSRIHVGVTTDSPLEVATSTFSAIASDPTPCLNAINPVHGQPYTHEAGATKWYKISMDLLKSQGATSSVYLANKSNKKAHVTIGLVPDCQYTTGTKVTLPLPAGFELGALAPNLLGRMVEELQRFETTYNEWDAKDVYLEVHSDQTLEFGLDVNNAITNPCLREDLQAFDWNNGVQVEADKAVWYDVDITTIKNAGKHVKLTFTNPTQSIVWVATVVSVNCPAELTVPMIVPVPAGMSVDHVIDYSIFAAADVDHLYVGVKAEDALKLTAKTIDADASASNQANCNAATLVESGKTYTHKAGAHWYHFQMSLLDNMGDAARVTFKNKGAKTAKLSAGVTVDCQYGIVNRVPVKVPHGVDMSLSVPARVINKVREWIDADVTDFYLHLDSDQELTFGVDMDAVSVTACSSAVNFDWQAWEANGLQIQANQDVWYKVNLDYPLEKLEKGEDIVVSLSNLANDMDVEVEIAVSPTCPALLSLEKSVTIPANEKFTKEFSHKEVMALLDQYNKYVYDSESEKLLGHYDTYVFFNKLEKLLGRYGKYVPFGPVDMLLKRYGAHLTVSGIIDMIENYEQYITVASLKKQLAAHKEYVSYEQLMGLLDQYGEYIPNAKAQQLLEQYGEYIPYLGGGAVMLLDQCEKYFTTDDLQKVVNKLKQHLPIDELKQLFKRFKKYLPEDNTCYVNVKSKGDLVVEEDTIPETPEGCWAAVELDYTKTYNLSELPTGWYKVGLDGIHAAHKDLELKLNNDLGADTVVTISAYKSCEDGKPLATRARKMKVGMNTESIPYALIQQYASGIDTLYLYLINDVQLCGQLSCETAVAFPWNTTVVVDKEAWYTINVDDLLALDTLIATVRNTTDLTVSANIEVSVVCPVDEDVVAVVKDFVAGYEKKEVLTVADIQDNLDQYGAYPGDVIYMHICPVGALELTLNAVKSVPETPCDETRNEPTRVICANELPYTWNVGTGSVVFDAAGTKQYVETLSCGKVTYNLTLNVLTDKDEVYNESPRTVCASELPYIWTIGNGSVEFTEAGTKQYVETLNCGFTATYNLTLNVKDCDPCLEAEYILWNAPIHLDANTNKWYKVDVASAVAENKNIELVVINGAVENTVFVEYGVECPSEDWATTTKTLAANAVKRTVITPAELAQAGAIDYVYVHIITTGEVSAKAEFESETEPCLEAEYILWNAPIHLDANTNKWYKVDVASAVAENKNIELVVINGAVENTVFVEYGVECPSDDWATTTKTLAANAVKRTVITPAELAQAGAIDYVYVHIITTGEVSAKAEFEPETEPCLEAEYILWNAPIHLEANTNKWYKVDVATAVESGKDIELVVVNGAVDNTVFVEYGVECPSDDWTSKTFFIEANKKETALITQNDLAQAGAIDYVYVHIITTGEINAEADLKEEDKPCYEYKTITGSVCDGDTYVDPITGKGHVISSLIAASQTWNDTVVTGLTCDSIYTFVITPTVAPKVMTEDLLATIPGAMPTLKPGCTVDVAGTIEAIKAYYELNDTEAIADVVNVEWVAGADAKLDCNATEHTMTLKVEAGCDFVINTTIKLTVEPIVANEHPTEETICEGESYTWAANGKSYTPTTSMTDVYEVTNDCGCVVDRYTLTLTVNKATETTLDAIPVEICETELPYSWNVADTTILCTETKTYTHTVVDGCSKTTHVLELTVNKATETTLDAIPVEICETELPYAWNVADTTILCTETKTYTHTVVDGCSKTTHVLELTVNKVEETTLAAIPVAICESELPYIWTVVEGVTVTCDKADTYTYTVDGECSKTIHVLALTVYATPEDVVEYDTICPGETITWNGVTFATAGEHTLTLQNENGCDYQATLHLHIPDPENYVAYDQIPAVSKYGGRMMVINLNAIDSIFGWTPAEGDVQWFKVVGEVDNAFDALNRLGDPAELDELVHTGYYHTAFDGSVMPDSYYALIVHEMVSGECQEIMRTTVLSSGAASETPKLVPTIAEPSEQLRILNLNPSNVTEVRVFNTSGELIENYTASEASEFVFKAATMQGYYMVEVQSENDKVTLRYIVK